VEANAADDRDVLHGAQAATTPARSTGRRHAASPDARAAAKKVHNRSARIENVEEILDGLMTSAIVGMLVQAGCRHLRRWQSRPRAPAEVNSARSGCGPGVSDGGALRSTPSDAGRDAGGQPLTRRLPNHDVLIGRGWIRGLA